MAPRKTNPTQPTPGTTVPAGRSNPNEPDQITFDTKDDGAGEDQPQVSGNFSAFYNELYDQAWVQLRSIKSIKERRNLLQKLYQKGFGSNTEVSPDGLDPVDIDRYRNLLVYQFTTKMTTDQIVRKIDDIFPDTRDTGGKTQKLTPKADVERIFADVMRVQLGRGPKGDELEKFRNAYYGMEKAGEAPSLQSAAEQQIMTANKGEARVQRFAGYMDVFEQMLRGA